ncbi:MmgE/PrpD family protein [Actinoallomurus sp. CA-142502]|uniref:MmgE/PrpD family protein n=1 Tax=Actinoallomurus sp. CA-142502 TaxID=3239885 RepID=UPI003D8C0899
MTLLTELAARAVRAPRRADAAARSLTSLHVLDTLGCVAAGATHPLASALAAVGVPGGGGTLTVTGLPGRHSLRTAVLIESTLAHVDESDALHPAAAVVPSAVTVPAALAVADQERRSGRAVVDAVLAGYETVVEAGLRFGGPRLYERSWWPTALFGGLGAAAATASLLDLDERRTVHALGIAAAGLGGLLGSDALGTGHYLLAGRAAADGVEAAYLARAGATAAPGILDDPAAAALGTVPAGHSGAVLHLTDCAFKAYPCARPLHAALDALTAIGEESLPLSTARRIEIELPEPLLRFVTADREPPGPTEAAASAAFAVGALLHGAVDDVSFYRGPLPPDVPDVALRPAPDLNAALPDRWSARVTVRGDDTVVRRTCEQARPPTADAVVARFRRRLGPTPDADARVRRYLALDDLPEVSMLRSMSPY